MEKHNLFRILVFIIFTTISFILTGCSLTGSLSDKEYDAIIDTLINEKIIENISNEEIIGAGEMEYIKYTFNTTSKNIEYKATLVQERSLENFRVFSLYLKDKNDNKKYIKYYITVDRECKIKIYDKWKKENGYDPYDDWSKENELKN